jgi:hypothetical protein
MDPKSLSKSDFEKINKLKRMAVALSSNIMEGKVGLIAGCIQMGKIAHEIFENPVENEDFVIFIVVSSDTDHLPTEETSKYWDQEILKEKKKEIDYIENYYKDDVFKACKSIIDRFSGV